MIQDVARGSQFDVLQLKIASLTYFFLIAVDYDSLEKSRDELQTELDEVKQQFRSFDLTVVPDDLKELEDNPVSL